MGRFFYAQRLPSHLIWSTPARCHSTNKKPAFAFNKRGLLKCTAAASSGYRRNQQLLDGFNGRLSSFSSLVSFSLSSFHSLVSFNLGSVNRLFYFSLGSFSSLLHLLNSVSSRRFNHRCCRSFHDGCWSLYSRCSGHNHGCFFLFAASDQSSRSDNGSQDESVFHKYL